MSLKVWLPLNGDLENLGTENLTITNSNATINTNGKIGSCYYFNGTDARISCSSMTYSYPISICAWIKGETITASGTEYILSYNTATGGTAGHNIGIGTYGGKLSVWHGGSVYSYNTPLTNNVWYHVAAVVTPTGYKLYLDGSAIVIGSGAQTDVGSSWLTFGARSNSATGGVGGASYFFKGYINDIRVYNHELSAKEIKEISQGLVLHYKLDDITNGVLDSSGYNNNGTIVGTCTAVESPPRYSSAISMNNTSTTNHIETTNDITFSDNISVSFWVKSALSNQVIFASKYIEFGILNSLGYVNPSASASYQLSSYFTANEWNHICVVKNAGTFTLYVNGQKPARNGANNNYLHNVDKLWILNRSYNSSYGGNGSVSDFRFYVTPLSDNDVLDLYHTSMSVDNLQNTHTFEFEEQDENVLAGIPWTSPYSTHSDTQNLFTNYNTNGEPQFTVNSTSAGSKYIEITPGTYYYDTTISVNTGNQFYIGFERYDADKTTRENNACAYIYTTKPSSDVVKQRYKGTVNLSTDGTNTLKYITLRILNGWSGTTSGVTGQATVHNLSLRLVSNAHAPKVKRTGEFAISELKEGVKSSLYKNDMVEAAEFIER